MKVLVTADVHLDAWQRAGRDPFPSLARALSTVDAVILAGDLTNNPRLRWSAALSRLSEIVAPEKVYIFPGNHDYYHFRLDGDDVLRGIVEDAGMNWAQKAGLEFDGVRFLCATLWTDFLLSGSKTTAQNAAWFAMNDYRQISRNAAGDLLLPGHTSDLHAEHLAWLTDEISRSFAGRTVIVTHHCPSPSATGEVDRLTPAFTSNLDDWIIRHRPDLWLFGHTHRHLSGRVGRTRIMNISLGYPDDVPSVREAEILLRGLVDTESPGMLAYGPP
ncbi:Calcineurin-like phosphoesterase [Gemmobacter megaterium]|uniref:Calcineurin-like phosphoesterase n=1 Tax=Gemmobacter megaterium TaxID=1086013 RepID=A0A1N7L456_9RHOB|nr:metallophosphoesterase [Gemmobacter megaterium]GGE05420.1 metallophosphoesterase [Gemmobacter megaterium]SIS68460.1 Calcineurin-like phosphoesterase [Gemmobacter megaterium]